MGPAMEGRKSKVKISRSQVFQGLRSGMTWLLPVTLLVVVLVLGKQTAMERFGQEGLESLRTRHPQVVSLFQSSFYFFYQ